MTSIIFSVPSSVSNESEPVLFFILKQFLSRCPLNFIFNFFSSILSSPPRIEEKLEVFTYLVEYQQIREKNFLPFLDITYIHSIYVSMCFYQNPYQENRAQNP